MASLLLTLRKRCLPLCKIFAPSEPRPLILLGFVAGLLIASGCLFGLLAKHVLTADRLTLLNEQIAQWMSVRASAGLTRPMWLISSLHATIALVRYTWEPQETYGAVRLPRCAVLGILPHPLVFCGSDQVLFDQMAAAQ